MEEALTQDQVAIPRAVLREFRQELRSEPPSWMNFQYNEFLLDLFEDRDSIDLRSALLVDFHSEVEEWVKGVYSTASVIAWGITNGLVEHVDKQGPSEAFRLLDSRQQFVLTKKSPGQISLRVIRPTLPLQEVEKLLAKEHRRIVRDGPQVMAETRALLDEAMERFPHHLLPHSLRRFRREGFELLRNYRDLLLDAAGSINGEWIRILVREALRETAGEAPLQNTKISSLEVGDDDADAISLLDFELSHMGWS